MAVQTLLQQVPMSCASYAVDLVESMAPTTAFGPLLRTVFEAIFEVSLMCLMGWILARRGILDKKTQKQLNRVNVSLFTPCLLFSKVAFSLSPSKLKELWIIPLFFIFVTGVSAGVAFLLGTVLRLRRTQRNFVMAAAMFSNSNSLPIALMQSLVVTVKGLKWGSDDTKDAMLGRALGYLVLYSTLGMMLRWSYGVHLLSQSDDETPGVDDIQVSSPTGGSLPGSNASSSSNLSAKAGRIPPRPPVPAELHRAVSGISSAVSPDQLPVNGPSTKPANSGRKASSGLRPPPIRAQSKRFFSSFPNSPAKSPEISPASTPHPERSTFGQSNLRSSHLAAPNSGSNAQDRRGKRRAFSPGPFDNVAERERLHRDTLSGRQNGDDEQDEVDVSDSEWGTHVPNRTPLAPSSSRTQQIFRRIKSSLKSFWKGFTTFMTMPLYAALASIIVALTPPLQHVLTDHVQPVKGFLTSAGNCSIPVTLVVLGAYFYSEPETKKPGIGNGVQKTIGSGKSTGRVSPPILNLRRPTDVEAQTVASNSSTTIVPSGSGLSQHLPSHQNLSSDDSDLEGDEHASRARLSLSQQLAHPSSVPPVTEDEPIDRPNPWSSASTLAGSMRNAFRMRGIRARLSRSNSQSHTGLTSEDVLGKEIVLGETKAVFAAVLSRMILTPLIVLPLVAMLAVFDLHPVFDDPVFVCSTVLLISAPPALTLAQITQAASGDAFERLISRTIFWAYCIFTPPLTLVYVIVALHFSRL